MKNPTAIVVAHASHAAQLQREIDPTGKKFKVLFYDQSIVGLRFDLILVTDSFYHEAYYSPPQRGQQMGQWMDQVLRLRLSPEGRMVRL